MRIIFCGTPEFAVPSLRRLAAHPEFSVEAVITQPDRPRGRGQHIANSPVKEAALEAGLHVYQPESIKSESAQEFLKRVAPDAVVIIAYGQIIPARLLDDSATRLDQSCTLPCCRDIAAPRRFTGPSPTAKPSPASPPCKSTQAWIRGRLLLQREIANRAGRNCAGIVRAHERNRRRNSSSSRCCNSMRGEISPMPQDADKASYAPILKKEDGRIDWTRTAQHIYNRMRGFTPWPGAYTTFREKPCHLWGRPRRSRRSRRPHRAGGNCFFEQGCIRGMRRRNVPARRICATRGPQANLRAPIRQRRAA